MLPEAIQVKAGALQNLYIQVIRDASKEQDVFQQMFQYQANRLSSVTQRLPTNLKDPILWQVSTIDHRFSTKMFKGGYSCLILDDSGTVICDRNSRRCIKSTPPISLKK